MAGDFYLCTGTFLKNEPFILKKIKILLNASDVETNRKGKTFFKGLAKVATLVARFKNLFEEISHFPLTHNFLVLLDSNHDALL